MPHRVCRQFDRFVSLLLTNSQSTGSDYVISPSLSSILSGGSYGNWCFPKNATGFPTTHNIPGGDPYPIWELAPGGPLVVDGVRCWSWAAK